MPQPQLLTTPPLTHLDLFSGIGGFALAARWTSRISTVGFCEIEPYCQALLRTRFPNIPIFADVRSLSLTSLREHNLPAIDLITGGFPCQPYSVAGRQGGHADPRDLWPQMRHLIAEIRPRWVVAENVPNFINLGLDRCFADLEAEGYEAWAFSFPACALGARHRRERLWIVANSNCEPNRRHTATKPLHGQERPTTAAEPRNLRQQVWTPHANKPPASSSAVANANHSRLQRHWRPEGSGKWNAWTGGSPLQNLWIAEPSVGRVAHGIPARVDRLRALGNAIVPQASLQILSEIVRLS